MVSGHHPAAHPSSLHIPNPNLSALWKAEQRGGHSQRHPAENLRAESFSQGRIWELRGAAGSSPSLMGQRIRRGGSRAAKKEQQGLGGSPGVQEHGADPNPPTVPGEPRGPKGTNKQTNKQRAAAVPRPQRGCDGATNPTGLRARSGGRDRWKNPGILPWEVSAPPCPSTPRQTRHFLIPHHILQARTVPCALGLQGTAGDTSEGTIQCPLLMGEAIQGPAKAWR